MRILIIEKDEKSKQTIIKFLNEIETGFSIFEFSDFESLNKTLNNLATEEKKNFLAFDLVILDYSLESESKWPERLELLKSYMPPEGRICLTAFDDTSTNRKYIFNLKIYNIFYKPFDELILKESLNIATKISKNPKPIEIKAQSAAASALMLKNIELHSVSEVGFISLSDTEIPLKSISKYFSPLFSYGKKQSAWAQCVASLKHPQKENLYICKFQYLAPDTLLLNNIRRYLQTKKQDKISQNLWNTDEPQTKIPIKIGLICPNDDKYNHLQVDLQNYFSNLEVQLIHFSNDKLDAENITADLKHIINFSNVGIEQLKKTFTDTCDYFYISELPFSEEELMDLSQFYKDIFIFPIEKSYFYKKLKIHIQNLSLNDPIHILNVSSQETVKASTQIKITEICELYLQLQYHKEMPFQNFREFLFISEDENQAVLLPAFSNYVEKSKSPPTDKKVKGPAYDHQFIFWGMTDHYLKQIRLWLHHNYITQKNQNKG